ncbi:MULTISPECIES: ATP-grasp domain-containing protein [Paraburkholderia]|uniref:ATP-grasp domain-containing protein n=1 Tax=Paraburkholderia TaxID=1822464 RepID=UPI0022530A1E|nr:MULTISPECIES: ATP-grasp domain-containing protein [Paraburkholderia]MCX4162801.1 ATP-grasp domain-containing protein [Paraburkholderia megapolitana]MDN7158296.1 ATP-grasp domain-containing protein [Paraburkholderia sp. CHISQ3]MDQ6495343.1 ATP-grasp domain-containing protein [Paraburkholderia megapolitana]
MHIVLVETTSVRGFDCVAEMVDAGIEVTFVAQNLQAHRAVQDAAQMARATRLIEVPELGQDANLYALLRERWGPSCPDGVICRRESFALEVAGLTEALGVPGETRATALLLGDKRAVRLRLASAGIGTVRWRSADGLDSALEAADALGYPVVIKPANGSFSLGVSVVHDRPALIRAWSEAVRTAASFAGGQPAVLLEEYLTGLHVSAELLVQGGEPILLGLAERDAVSPGVTAETGGYFPASFPGAERAAEFAQQVVKALGICHSAVHIEMMVTPRGPELIEVNGRVAGHVVMQQISLALGRSVTMDLVALATGRNISPPGDPVSTVALRQVWSDHDGIVVRVQPPVELHPQVVSHGLFVETGSQVAALRSNPDRFGYVLARGADRNQATTIAVGAAAQLLGRLEIARIPPVDYEEVQPSTSGTGHVGSPAELTPVPPLDRAGPDA